MLNKGHIPPLHQTPGKYKARQVMWVLESWPFPADLILTYVLFCKINLRGQPGLGALPRMF